MALKLDGDLINEERLTELMEAARRSNVTIEELMYLSIEDLASRPDAAFQDVTKYTLRKKSSLSAAGLMRYLRLDEVSLLYRRIIQQSGGTVCRHN